MADASIGSAYLQVIPKMDEGALKSSMASAGQSGSKQFGESFKSGISSKSVALGNIMSEAIIKGVDVASKAATDVFVEAFTNYANFEQLAGGVEKIFDEMDTSRIFKDAGEAWKTLNMSANDYMATINDVGAMFSATMGDEAAYEAARKGMQAISDYSSGTGKNLDVLNDKFAMITRATSSYQSIADQFSGILPATSKDFLEQAQAAGMLSTEYEKLTDVPIAEYQSALVEMLEKGTRDLGLYGNTAEETANTVSGSIAAMKSAWSNWLTGLADENADMGQLTDNLVESIGAVVDNAIPRIQTIAERVGPAMGDAIGKALHEMSPEAGEFFDKVGEGADKVAEGLGKIADQAAASGVLEQVGDAIVNIGNTISESDLGPFFNTLADALGAINDMKASQELDEAATALKNMGEIPDLLNPQSWHNGTDAVVEWNRQVNAAGVTAEEYRKLTDSEMTAVSRAFETNGYSMEKALNSVGFTLDATTGKISKLSDTPVEDKEFEVSDGGTTDKQRKNISLLNTSLGGIRGPNYTVSDEGSADKAKSSVNSLIEEIGKVNSKSVSVTADVTGYNSVANLVDMINNVRSKTVDIVSRVFQVKSATGSFAESPYIPEHAAGYIATGPTLTNNGWVGEDGAEAVLNWATGGTVIPLTNTRYMRPIADAIADEMGGASSGGDTYIINGITLDSRSSAQRAFEQAFRELRIAERA